ncbi:MAG TPA: hypothetical protein VK762_34425, partial [Polyangiaceae bacterium]|nr:hypothetical protein [Polyangiaceae bacterium]
VVDASSGGVVAGGLEEELHPIPATPAPRSEAAANPIKYREARIGNTLRQSGTIRRESVVTQ